MLGKLLLLGLIAAVCAGDSGYNYHSSAPSVVQTPHQTHHDEGVEKQFYYFNAPEEKHVHHVAAPPKITTHVKKNLQVIFIKPPEEKHHYKKPVLNVVNNNVEEKTHIYVLTKEPSHVAPKKTQIIQQSTVHHHKPELHFLKYRTPSDAHNIQQSIIQQYGGKPSEVRHLSLGGNSFGGSNFGGSSFGGNSGGLSVSREYLAPPASNVEAPANGYIPPALRS